MEIYFYYNPEEKQTRWEPGCFEEYEFYKILINGKRISVDLEDHLIEFFGDKWIEELIEIREFYKGD
jgi:hypothetical protein